MSTETKKSGVMAQIIVGIVIALCVGGSSPWWLKEVKEIFAGPAPEPQAASQTQTSTSGGGGSTSNSSYLAGLQSSGDISERQKVLETELEEIKKQQEDERPARPVRGQLNISGTYHDADSQATFYQIGNTVTMEEFTPGYGRTAVGQGTIDGNEITMTIQTIFNTQGTLSATVSDDGRQITGTYTDAALGTAPYSVSR